jgi:hypothetical protein
VVSSDGAFMMLSSLLWYLQRVAAFTEQVSCRALAPRPDLPGAFQV